MVSVCICMFVCMSVYESAGVYNLFDVIEAIVIIITVVIVIIVIIEIIDIVSSLSSSKKNHCHRHHHCHYHHYYHLYQDRHNHNRILIIVVIIFVISIEHCLHHLHDVHMFTCLLYQPFLTEPPSLCCLSSTVRSSELRRDLFQMAFVLLIRLCQMYGKQVGTITRSYLSYFLMQFESCDSVE